MLYQVSDTVVAHAIPGLTVDCMIRGVIPIEEATDRTFHAHHRACGVCQSTHGQYRCQQGGTQATAVPKTKAK